MADTGSAIGPCRKGDHQSVNVTLKGQRFAIKPYVGDEVRVRRGLSDRQLADLTTDAYGEPGELLQRWLSLADVMVVASQDGTPRGFMMGRLLRPDVLLFIAAMVHPVARRLGLLSYMSAYVVWVAWLARVRSAGWRLWQSAQTLYLTFRTANPVLYSSVAKKVRLNPSPDCREVSSSETEIATLVARAYGVEDGFDRTTFVMHGALLPYPDLIYRPNRIPWCDDRAINDFFRELLRLEEMQGNDLVAVGKVPVGAAFTLLASKRLAR